MDENHRSCASPNKFLGGAKRIIPYFSPSAKKINTMSDFNHLQRMTSKIGDVMAIAKLTGFGVDDLILRGALDNGSFIIHASTPLVS